MDNKNEENKNLSQKSLGEDQEISQNVMGENNIPIQRQAFQIELPDGRTVNTETMSDDQYMVATSLQFLQRQIEELSRHVAEFNMKQDHFRLKQNELQNMIPPDGKPS